MEPTAYHPQHVAIIMDGNGRWAKARGMPRALGHKKGSEALTNLLQFSKDFGIRYLTLYAFSAENWQRPSDEVNDLIALLEFYLDKKKALLDDNLIRLRVIGDLSKFDSALQNKIQQTVEETSHYSDLHLTIAISYGARQELTEAVRKIARDVQGGTLAPEAIDTDTLSSRLYTHDLPEPDLLIRTGGEKRLSNFLLWQCAYTELFFTDIFWPDFDAQALRNALDEYQRRDRRFGTVRAS